MERQKEFCGHKRTFKIQELKDRTMGMYCRNSEEVIGFQIKNLLNGFH